VYGPPPICKDDHAAMETGLAVVYPALSRGDTAAGPDGIRGSATGQMDELAMARIISSRSDRFAITLCSPSQAGAGTCLAPCGLCRLSGNPLISLLSGDHRPKGSCGLVSNRYCCEVDRSPCKQLLQPGPRRHILSEARSDDRSSPMDQQRRR
jgi:hypothetical protein